MNILHLEASPGWGGQEIRILREAEGMRQRGHTVIFGVMSGGTLITRARAAGFTVYALNFKRPAWILCLFQLLLIMRRHCIQVVNTHSSLDSWIGAVAARLSGRVIIRTRHLSTPIKAGWNSRILYGKLTDFVVTTCSSIIPMICAQSGKKPQECRSIPTGVDPEKIVVHAGELANFRKAMGVTPSDFLIGTACFMRSWKGIDDFLKAAHILRDVSHLKWVIIGGGHAVIYRQRACEMQLDKIIHFTGHLDNPFPALQALDLFILLSTAHEGVSQTILQAAYLEKPLLATPTGGLAEVCIDQITGIQVPPFAPDQVAKAICHLQQNPALCQQFGKNAKRLTLEKFTFVHTLNHMEEVYKSFKTS